MGNFERFAAAKALTEAWLTAHGADAVGMPEDELVAKAAASGIAVRVISRDGASGWLTAEHSATRINVVVVDGRVKRVDGAY